MYFHPTIQKPQSNAELIDTTLLVKCLTVMCRHFDNINTIANYEYISSVVTISITIVISVSQFFNCFCENETYISICLDAFLCVRLSSYLRTSENRAKRKPTISSRPPDSLKSFTIRIWRGAIFCEGNLPTIVALAM